MKAISKVRSAILHLESFIKFQVYPAHEFMQASPFESSSLKGEMKSNLTSNDGTNTTVGPYILFDGIKGNRLDIQAM